MAFYTYKNCKIQLNEQPLFVESAAIDFAARPEPTFYSLQRHSFDYIPTNAIGGSLSISYILTGIDPIKEYFEEEKTSITGSFGGLEFKSGYLSSYSIQARPASPVVVQADIVFFDDLKGSFNPVYEQAEETAFLNFSDAKLVRGSGIGDISNILNFNFNYSSEVEPVIRAGETVPSEVKFGKKSITLGVDIDNLSGDLSITGNSVTLQLNLKPHDSQVTVESFAVKGKLTQKNIRAAANEPIMTSLSVRQDFVPSPPEISSFNPSAFRELDEITIYGSKLSTTIYVCFGPVCTQEITVISDGEIRVKVPYGASAVDPYISLANFGGERRSEITYTLLFADMKGSYALPFSGYPGDEITIYGQNFDRITDVLFPPNDIPATSFSVAGRVDLLNGGQESSTTILARVPELASKGAIKVVASDKDQSVLSHTWLPLPQISDFDPTAGDVGQLVGIHGQSFIGLTGAHFNNLPTSFAVTDSISALSTVPDGDAHGKIKVMGFTDHIPIDYFAVPGGITFIAPQRRSFEALSVDNFEQDVAVTGFQQDVAYFGTWEPLGSPWPTLKNTIQLIVGGTDPSTLPAVDMSFSFMAGGSLRRENFGHTHQGNNSVFYENLDMRDYVDGTLNTLEFSGEIVSAMNEWKDAFENWFPGLQINLIDRGTELTTGLASDYYGDYYDMSVVAISGIGDIRFSMSPLDGQGGTLAYGWSPGVTLEDIGSLGGDVRFDSTEDWRMDGDPHTSDPDAHSVKLTAAHELGHVFGIEHNDNPDSLMFQFAYTSQSFSELFPIGLSGSLEEKEAILAIYGGISIYDIEMAKAGSPMIIQGKNFWPTRLDNIVPPRIESSEPYISSASGVYGVLFRDNITVGYTGLSPFGLTGLVPLNASSGPVHLYGPDTSFLHPSGKYLEVIPPLGVITSITPGTIN